MYSKAKELEIAVLTNDSKTVSRILKSLRKQLPNRQERLFGEDGLPAATYTEERILVRGHCMQTLDGVITKLAALVNSEKSLKSPPQSASRRLSETSKPFL